MNWFTKIFNQRSNPNASGYDQTFNIQGTGHYDIGKVNEAKMLSIPCVAAAINLYAGVVSSCPLEIHTFNNDTGNFVLDENNPLWDVISEFSNDEMTSVDWMRFVVRRVFINGRSLSHIERVNGSTNIYPLDNTKFEIKITAEGSKRYIHKATKKVFMPSEVIDISWDLKPNTFEHVDPSKQFEEFFENCLLAEKFANSIFKSGPLPPMVAYKKIDPTTPNQQKVSENASRALSEAMKAATAVNGIVNLPDSMTLADLPYDPSKSQLIEARKLQINEASRIYNVPPALLHDLSSGTFNNTEQQAANFLKFSLSPLLFKIEKELSLKLLGRKSPKSSFIRFNTDELLRGDLKSFISAYSMATDKGIMTRDEVRYKMNLPLKGGSASELSQQLQFVTDKGVNDNENNNKYGGEPTND